MAKDYSPIPTVEPRFAPTPKVQEGLPHVQFSTAVGEALSYVGGAGYGTLGRGIEGVGQAFDKMGANLRGAGNEVFDRALALKQLESDHLVNDLTIKTWQDLEKKSSAFRTKEGANAGSGPLEASLKEMSDYVEGQKHGLTPEQQKKYEGETRGIIESLGTRNVTHSAQQVHQGHIATNNAMIKTLQDRASHAQTIEEFTQTENELRTQLSDQADLMGWSKETAEAKRNEEISKSRIGWLSVRGDSEPTTAMQILEQAWKDGHVLENDYRKSRDELEGKLIEQVARNAGDRAKQNPEAPLAEKVKTAEDEARKVTDNPKAISAAGKAARQENAEYWREKADQQRRDVDVLDAFTHGRANPEGKMPTKREEIDLNPEVKKAFEGSSNHVKNAVLERLGKNSLNDYLETPDEVETFHRLKGMSYDPANYEMFRNLAVMDLQVSKRHRDQLLDRKDEIGKQGVNAMDNPHVGRALNVLSQNGLIPDAVRKDPDRMNTLRGVIHDEVDLQQKLQKGPMTESQIISLGRQITATDPKSGFWGMFKTPQFETLGARKQEYVDWYQRTHSGASEDEALRTLSKIIYEREFQKFHSGQKTAPTTSQAPNALPPPVSR